MDWTPLARLYKPLGRWYGDFSFCMAAGGRHHCNPDGHGGDCRGSQEEPLRPLLPVRWSTNAHNSFATFLSLQAPPPPTTTTKIPRQNLTTKPSTLHPTPYTLHPTPYTPHHHQFPWQTSSSVFILFSQVDRAQAHTYAPACRIFQPGWAAVGHFPRGIYIPAAPQVSRTVRRAGLPESARGHPHTAQQDHF